jgi:hypothetical protein
MTLLREGLPKPPPGIAHLPRDTRGFPIPWFVHVVNGVPDFRVVRPGGVLEALREHRCWICGVRPLGTYRAFVVGPLGALNGINSEPPSHKACALWAVKACPFLAKPRMSRNENDLPQEGHYATGLIKSNPGVCCVWVTKTFKVRFTGGDYLIDLGEPTETMWFTQGRRASRSEVIKSVDIGLPLLREIARREGDESLAALHRQYVRVSRIIPPEDAAA